MVLCVDKQIVPEKIAMMRNKGPPVRRRLVLGSTWLQVMSW